MKSISFDNPWLLLLLIPLLLAIVVPYLISINKENKTKGAVASLVLHILIAVCVTFAAAGTVFTTVMTQTHVYVVADCSYSAQEKWETVDGYVRSIEKNLPRNSKMGVIAFAGDCVVLTEMGGDFISVKDAPVDADATDVAGALDYAASRFDPTVIKKIVLITDGNETVSDSSERMIAAVENLYGQNIGLDAIYLDTNLAEDTEEVQISAVDFNESVYTGQTATADLLVQSNRNAQVILSVFKDGESYEKRAVELSKGYNVINVQLDTRSEGEFFYEFRLALGGDVTVENNERAIVQKVTAENKILLVYGDEAERDKVIELYQEKATVDAYFVEDALVPFSVEQMCGYDEIILAGCDVRKMQNYTAFVDSVEQAVSVFGKSLITTGNLYIQNRTADDAVLDRLQDILPVKFGNSDRDPKLVAIVLDISRSMQHSYQYQIGLAKEAAKQIVNMLESTDDVMIVPFAGDNSIVLPATPASKKNEIEQIIDGLSVTQGTMLGAALEATYAEIAAIADLYSSKEVYVISDGLTSETDAVEHEDLARKMFGDGVVTSSIYVYRPGEDIDENKAAVALLQGIAENGGGKYYVVKQNTGLDIILNDMAEDLREDVVLKKSEVAIAAKNDAVLSGITSLPNVSGYVYAKSKASATTVLTLTYVKASDTGNGENKTTPPLYSYWNYGNGKVSCLMTTLSGEWAEDWQNDERAERFLDNLLERSKPSEKTDVPYSVTVENLAKTAKISLTPANRSPYASAKLLLTLPDGTQKEYELAFDSQNYVCTVPTESVGRYGLVLTYIYDGKEYVQNTEFVLDYFGEYDEFDFCDRSVLKDVIRNRGVVHTDADFAIETDKSNVDTYELDLTLPLLIVAICAYIPDIMVRKLKWDDIRMLFKKNQGGA